MSAYPIVYDNQQIEVLYQHLSEASVCIVMQEDGVGQYMLLIGKISSNICPSRKEEVANMTNSFILSENKGQLFFDNDRTYSKHHLSHY